MKTFQDSVADRNCYSSAGERTEKYCKCDDMAEISRIYTTSGVQELTRNAYVEWLPLHHASGFAAVILRH